MQFPILRGRLLKANLKYGKITVRWFPILRGRLLKYDEYCFNWREKKVSNP